MTTLSSKRRPLLCALALGLLALALPATSQAARGGSPYRHLGAWIDIYDAPLFSNPCGTVSKMKHKNVRTLYVETSNDRASATIAFPPAMGKMLNCAHNTGIKVVAWTLPGHYNAADDKKKAMAALHFKSARGDSFDGFALDMESTKVDVATRNARLLELSRQIRAATSKPLGAITFSPVFIKSPWPHFPWKKLDAMYDAFLPMAYSSYHYHSRASVRTYTRQAVKILQTKTTKRIHVVGGVASGMSTGDMKGFVSAIKSVKPSGASVYDIRTTSPSAWPYLKRIP
jgi:hypothetical protein